MSRLLPALLLLVALPAQAIEVQRVVSEGGIEAWLVEDHTNPLIALQLSFRGAGALDPGGKSGLARLAASTLDEGAGDLDSQAFQGRLDDLAVTLRFDAGRDTFFGRLKTLTENRDEAFRLLHLALTAPRFDEEPVERIRSQILASLRRASTQPQDIASRTMFRELFPGHAYARSSEGTQDGVKAVTRDDLGAFVKERLAKDNLAIGVTGDVTSGNLARLLDQTFGDLPEKAAPWALPEIQPAVSGKTLVKDLATPQSRVLFAQGGLKRDHPDFYTGYVLNYILGGGGFSSRLYGEVREKRGLAYSVGSYFYPFDHTALMLGAAGTANERVSETIGVVKAEWKRLAVKGVNREELNDAKLHLTGSFPLRFSDSDSIARILVAMQLGGLGIDFLEKRNGYIEAVTLEAANALAKTLLTPDKLTFVVVGKPDGLKASAR